MAVAVKVCGLTDLESLRHAVTGGARFVGFVFFARSPRAVTPVAAQGLASHVPTGVARVGVVVDAEDEQLSAILSVVPLDMIQCHGSETPDRVRAIRSRFGLPVIKAIGVASSADVADAERYQDSADMLLFDSLPPSGSDRPGGNARSFSWSLMRLNPCRCPWLLSGGLKVDNLTQAVQASGATAVDVSSGVEESPGHKDPLRIDAFLSLAKNL